MIYSITVINKYLIRDRKNQVFGIKKDAEPKIMLHCTTKKAKKQRKTKSFSTIRIRVTIRFTYSNFKKSKILKHDYSKEKLSSEALVIKLQLVVKQY